MQVENVRHAFPIRQLFRFALSTAISASLTVGLPILLHEGLGMDERPAVAIAFVAALMVNFVVMRHFVFAARGSAREDMVRYVVTNTGFRLAEYAAFALLFTVLRLGYIVALLIVLGTSTVLKFVTYRLVVFGQAAG